MPTGLCEVVIGLEVVTWTLRLDAPKVCQLPPYRYVARDKGVSRV